MNRFKFLLLILGAAMITEAKAQEVLVFHSPENLKCDDTVRVYTPAAAPAHATLILLHGWSGCYRNWGDKMDIQAISDRTGFRIITPDGFYNSWYVNNTDRSKMQTRDFYNKELIPQLFEKYSLDPETTFIDGLSMGGHGAVNIFIDNHDKFRAAGSMSGVLNLDNGTLVDELRKVFGNELHGRLVSESAVTNLPRIAGTDKIILVSCGYSDRYIKCAEEFTKACKELKIPYIRTDSPGRHSWKFWEFALNQHLWYFQRILDGAEMGY